MSEQAIGGLIGVASEGPIATDRLPIVGMDGVLTGTTVFFDIENSINPRWLDEYSSHPYDHRGAYQHTHKGKKPKRGLGAKRVKHVTRIKPRTPLVWRMLSYSKKARRIPSGWVVRHSVNAKGRIVRDVEVDHNIAYNFRKRTGYYRGGN